MTTTIECPPSLYVIVIAICKLHVTHDAQGRHPKFNRDAAAHELAPYVKRLFAQPLKHSQESALLSGLLDLLTLQLALAFKSNCDTLIVNLSQQIESLAAHDEMSREVGGPL